MGCSLVKPKNFILQANTNFPFSNATYDYVRARLLTAQMLTPTKTGDTNVRANTNSPYFENATSNYVPACASRTDAYASHKHFQAQ